MIPIRQRAIYRIGKRKQPNLNLKSDPLTVKVCRQESNFKEVPNEYEEVTIGSQYAGELHTIMELCASGTVAKIAQNSVDPAKEARQVDATHKNREAQRTDREARRRRRHGSKLPRKATWQKAGGARYVESEADGSSGESDGSDEHTDEGSESESMGGFIAGDDERESEEEEEEEEEQGQEEEEEEEEDEGEQEKEEEGEEEGEEDGEEKQEEGEEEGESAEEKPVDAVYIVVDSEDNEADECEEPENEEDIRMWEEQRMWEEMRVRSAELEEQQRTMQFID